jgi:hypothetical protein
MREIKLRGRNAKSRKHVVRLDGKDVQFENGRLVLEDDKAEALVAANSKDYAMVPVKPEPAAAAEAAAPVEKVAPSPKPKAAKRKRR